MNSKEFCVEEMQNDLSSNPSCPHGPTLLFSRKFQNEFKKFYACSAIRDRKLCPFFLWADKQWSESSKHAWDFEKNKFLGDKSHIEIHDSVLQLQEQISENNFVYCHSCSKFIVNLDDQHHKGHKLECNLDLNSLKWPSKLLKPVECDKKEAQYFFTESSVKVMIDIVVDNNIQSVICIGTPRIHEFIQNSKSSIRSILLDFDRRYHMFYDPSKFCWYNAFNNHFFFSKAKEHFINFLVKSKGRDIMIILDPPFGGRLEPLSFTLHSIQELIKQSNPHDKCDVPVLFIYPYFMEQHIAKCLPKFKMVDYIVTYDNHSKFSAGPLDKKSKSPVRIFTNMNLNKIKLPPEEGYRFCTICDRWVCYENKHCEFCGNCPSKNGSTYVHCFKCNTCVKLSWKHCKKCNRCCLVSHLCNPLNVSDVKCQNCGKEGHEQQNCRKAKKSENRLIIAVSGKRKQSFKKVRTKKRRKYNIM